MPPLPPKLYDLKKTTIAFSIASLLLFIGLVVMVLQDSSREWKSWQRRFMEYNRLKAEADLDKARKAVDEKKIQELKFRLDSAKAQQSAQAGETEKTQKKLAQIDIELAKAKTRPQNLKQEQDSDRYFFEEYQAHHQKEKAEKYKQRLEKRAPELENAKRQLEQLEAKREAETARLFQFNEAQRKLEKEIGKIRQDPGLLEKKVKKFRQNWVNAVLNAPMLDFIRPSLQIQQIVVEHLYDDYYFSKPQKVDRCITCHLGIDQKELSASGGKDTPAPFKSHPRLDLFLSADSPHPMETFGCTVCHGGSGHSVSFVTAAHTPQNKEQAVAWEKEYHWHPMKHWAEKMLPLNHVQASCAKCHSGVGEVPQALKLNEGRRIAQTFGCFGCHKVEGFSASGGHESWKVAPSLEHVQSKLEQDWIVRWLHNPREFRASTKMPRIFHLSNTSDPADVEKSNTVIAGIAAYLIKNSDPVSLQSPPQKGDPKAGEKLVKERGCLGCHTSGEAKANNYGPELSGLGSKVKEDWLYTWLKNPKHYSPETRMPNLRLSDEEASHIVSFLLAQKNEKFESLQVPPVAPKAVDETAMEFLRGGMRFEEAASALEKMTPDERLEWIGKKAIGHQGCFGCHTIKGFEEAKPIGTELTEEGSKDVEKFYFGFVPLEHTRQAWFFQKLKEPRVFDQGKSVSYLEKLKMPQFDFTDGEAEALTTFLLSLQKAAIPLEMRKRLNMREEQIEAGRLLVSKFNCQGCHTLDGKEGAARALFSAQGGSGGDDKGNAPPILDGEGKKVQPGWLYHFLESPSTIRPWLTYRMPTFGFKEKELTDLVQYFNQLDRVPPHFTEGKISHPSHEEPQAGRKLFESFQCIKCHKSNPEPGLSSSFLAPNLEMSKERLRPDWVLEWLKDPQVLQPGTMMPTFFPEGQSPVQDILGGDAAKQIQALRDHLWIFGIPEASALAVRVETGSASKAAE